MQEAPTPPSPEKERPVWRELCGNADDARAVIRLESEQAGSNAPFFPDEATLQKIRYEGLILEQGTEAVGRIRLTIPELAPVFPPSTLPINFTYVRPSVLDEKMRLNTLEVIKSYAQKKGFQNIGWFAADSDMVRITGLTNLTNRDGVVSVPLGSFNDEALKKMAANTQSGPSSLN